MNGCIDRARLRTRLQPPDTADEVNAIVKNLGVAASDIHLGETPARLRSKRTPLADYSIVYFASTVSSPTSNALVLSLPNRV